MPRQKSEELTAHQLEVLHLVASRISYQEIADQLVRSPRTIEHVDLTDPSRSLASVQGNKPN